MKKWLLLLVTVTYFLLFVVGCNDSSGGQNSTNDNQSQDEQEVNSDEPNDEPFPVTITDAFGKTVTINEAPTKVITLLPSITETIFALGKGDIVIGRTDWCNYPDDVFAIESVGDGMTFDVEKVVALKPDLVFVHVSTVNSYPQGLEQLENANVTVVAIEDATSMNDVEKFISTIGEIVGAAEKANEINKNMAAVFNRITEISKTISENDRVSVWVEISPAPDIYTVGKSTFMDEMLTMINAINVAGDLEGWIPFTEEDAVALNPDVIVTTYGYYTENVEETVKSRQGWKEVNAIKNGRVYDVHSDKVTRSGPRLVEGVEELARIIYPNIFK